MKRRWQRLAVMGLWLAGLAGGWALLGPQPAQAQVDDFTYFIPYPADQLDDQFDIANNDNTFIDDDILTTISIAVQRGETIIYYDHWEGAGPDQGLETVLTSPRQPSTQVWGDDNPANGLPPGFSTDLLNAGDVIVLQNWVTLPRDPGQFFFDGGDKFTAVSGSVAVTLAVWPELSGSLFAGAWELYPTSRWNSRYTIPIGQDLAGSGPGQRPGFSIVGFNVQALEPNTTLQIDLDGDGTFEQSETIAASGGHFTQISGTQTGAVIESSAPVQVHVLTGNNSPGVNYEARAYTIQPCRQFRNDYLAPRSSDGDFWLYNTDASTPLTVTAQTPTTVTTLIIPAGRTVRYPPSGPLLGATGVRFTASDGRSFCALAALDESSAQDWGYPVLPVPDLTTQVFIGWGAGNVNQPPDGDESRVYVTALTTTTLFVDYNRDGAADATVPITPLAEVPVIDPDHDLTGAYLYTTDGVRFAAVWGQDQSAPPAEPSIDVGTGIVPIPSLLLQKTVGPLSQDIDCTGSVTLGDIIQYKVEYLNNSVSPITNIIIEDHLPPEVRYLAGSTRFDGTALPDAATGSPFRLDEGGYNVGDLAALAKNSLTFEVVVADPTDLLTNQAEARSLDMNLSSDTITIYTPLITQTAPIYQIASALLDPAEGQARPGQVITVGLTITNTSGSPFVLFPAENIFDETELIFVGAEPPPDVVEPGRIAWNDLTATFGELPNGAAFSLTMRFRLADLPPEVGQVSTTAIGAGGRLSDGTILPVCSSQALVTFPAPGPTLTPTPPATETASPTATSVTPTPTESLTPTPATASPTLSPTATDEPEPETATPPPPPSVTPAPPGTVTPVGALPTGTVIPVALLPETGQPPVAAPGLVSLIVLLVIGLGRVVGKLA